MGLFAFCVSLQDVIYALCVTSKCWGSCGEEIVPSDSAGRRISRKSIYFLGFIVVRNCSAAKKRGADEKRGINGWDCSFSHIHSLGYHKGASIKLFTNHLNIEVHEMLRTWTKGRRWNNSSPTQENILKHHSLLVCINCTIKWIRLGEAGWWKHNTALRWWRRRNMTTEIAVFVHKHPRRNFLVLQRLKTTDQPRQAGTILYEREEVEIDPKEKKVKYLTTRIVNNFRGWWKINV